MVGTEHENNGNMARQAARCPRILYERLRPRAYTARLALTLQAAFLLQTFQSAHCADRNKVASVYPARLRKTCLPNRFGHSFLQSDELFTRKEIFIYV